MPIIEIVPLRTTSDGTVEILLLEREADDPVWPGQLHVPGTVIRASDTPGSYSDAFERVLSGELKDVAATEPTFAQNILHHSGRGMESSQIYWVEVFGTPTVGTFYTANQLPSSVVQSQLDFIPQAITAYRQAH